MEIKEVNVPALRCFWCGKEKVTHRISIQLLTDEDEPLGSVNVCLGARCRKKPVPEILEKFLFST